MLVGSQMRTARVVTNSSGTVLDDSDFYPFGGERVISSSSGNTYKFESKERDAETGNDDFGARFYASRYGRFLSVDWSALPAPVPYANLTNPETFADLDGHVPANYFQKWDEIVDPDRRSTILGNSLPGGDMTTAEEAEQQLNPERVAQQQRAALSQQEQQDLIIGKIVNFDKNVDAATNAALARGSSADGSINNYPHTAGLAPQQKRDLVRSQEEDLHKKDLQKAVDSYVSTSRSPQELREFLGRLVTVQHNFEEANKTAERVVGAIGWLVSKLPYGGVIVGAAKVLTPSPAQIQLIDYGKAATFKRLNALGAEP